MGSDLQKLRLSLGGVETPCMGGDNLAVCLASLFEPGIESDELDGSGTWKQGAIDAMDQVLDAVHAHYAARIAELEAALSAATAERDEARRERDDAESLRDLFKAQFEEMQEQKGWSKSKRRIWLNFTKRIIAKETAAREAAEAEAARLREALTPSGDTKAAYSGEIITEVRCRIFATGEVLKEDLQLPWVTIKDVMRMIARRAALGAGQ